MAENLQLLKRRIKTAQNISQVARAMEMVSASKIKHAQVTMKNNKPYAQKIATLTTNILAHVNLEKFQHPYVKLNSSPKTLLIIVSPDKGLCGSLNTNLARKLIEIDNKDLRIVALGKKARRFSQNLDGQIIASFDLGTRLPDYSLVFKLIEIINQEYETQEISKVEVLFSEFESIFSQTSNVRTILPIKTDHEEGQLPYIFEPKAELILYDLLPYYIEVVLFSLIIESFTSEQAARMIAMQNAKNNALDIADYLTLSYNKSRQERITYELLTLANNT